MKLTAAAAVWAEGDFDWAWLRQRVALPPQFPLPLPPGRVRARVAASVAGDGSAKLDITLTYRLPWTVWLFGGKVEVGRRVGLALEVQLGSAAAVAAAHDAWYSSAPASRLAGKLCCDLELRLAALPATGPIALHGGDAAGWIGVRALFAAGDSGASLELQADHIGEAALQMPALPLSEPPLRMTLSRVRGSLQAVADRWEGQLAINGRLRFAPRIEAGNVALLGYLAPLLEGVDLYGDFSCTLQLAQRSSLLLSGSFDNAEVGVDLPALLRELSRGLSATQPMPALDIDLKSRSRLGFRFAGIAVRIDEDPRFAIELSASMAGLTLPAHLELSRRELLIGLGTSSLAAQALPLELPLRVPQVSAADLGYAGGVAAARVRPGAKPADQSIWDRVSPGQRTLYDRQVQLLVDAVETLTGAAAGSSGVVVARRRADGWDIALREPTVAPDDDLPLYVGSGAVQAQRADGSWAATADAALVCRVDGRWSVLLAAPRLRFGGFHLAVDLHNPRNIRVGGTIAFVFTDGRAQQQVIEAQAELSADAIYFAVRQVDSPPIRAGEVELRIARLLFGFGYTKRSLAMALAGELNLPQSLVDAIDVSDLAGAGIRVPQQTRLAFKFELVPLVFGQVVIPVPFFQFDWDGRKKTSAAIQDARLCEPFWDGAQLIVKDLLRVSLKRLSFNPVLGFFACANSDFDADLALGTADNGLTLVADNIFWAYGQDSWTANLLAPINLLPFCDNFCIGLRGGGFRLNFNLQRPLPTFSPMAIFELIALAVDIDYRVAPRGDLADSVRISITDTYFVLPPAVRRLFPAAGGVVAKPFEATINLADYFLLLQGGVAALRKVLRAALRARGDLAQLPQRLRAEAAQLQDGGITRLLADMLAALPGGLRATRLDASFAGFDGSAVLVLADPARVAAELDARSDPASHFNSGEFAEFAGADLAALAPPASSAALSASDLRPSLALAVRGGRGAVARALRNGLSAALRRELDEWDGALIEAPLREQLATGLNAVLAGAGRGATLVSRAAARSLARAPAHAELAEREPQSLTAAELLQLNRALLQAALPDVAPQNLMLVVGARLRIAGTQQLAWLGSLAADGRFMFISSMRPHALQLQVAGLVRPLPLDIVGRLTLSGRSAPVEGQVMASVHADWEAIAGSARLRIGSAAKPATLALRSDGRFRVLGAGVLSIGGDTLRIEGEADISDSHALLRGSLRHEVPELVDLTLDLAGAIGPGARFEMAGGGALSLLGMPLADVEGRIDTRRLTLAGRLKLAAWQPGGSVALPIELDLRLAGGMELGQSWPNLRLTGSGRISLFGAEIADGRAGVEMRRTDLGGKPVAEMLTWVEGTLRWHGRDWLGARVELETRRVRVSGRSTMSFDLTPPGIPAGLLLTLGFEAAITLDLPQGELEALSLQGDWWLGVRQGSQGHVVPIAVGSLPPLTEKGLPHVLLSIPGFALPKLDARLDLPMPVLDAFDPASFSIPTSITLPELDKSADQKAANLFDVKNLTALPGPTPFSFLTDVRYKNLGSTPTLALGGLGNPQSIPTRFVARWPGAASLPLPFEPVAGFTVVLDWDGVARRLVLSAEPRQPVPKIDVLYDPKGVDLDAEFVAFFNDSDKPLDLTGWSVRDAADNERRFVFPAITLAPGATLRVWSGSGVDDANNLYWGRRQAVWNNLGDTAILCDARGVEQHRVSFGPRQKPP